ncbi:MAG: helicase-exonuclease AddAB subunit AddA [Clostridiales bacterium]|nr:helicase-exonuclease AddAB subunit AddA [Clostridiales bacterium]
MGVSWTSEQQQVIDLRNRNILVSAAAGSGKTAVLVERIIKIITDKKHPVDIDRLLVVTFTNAAAAEMRERIGDAIEKALKEQPEDEHLQRQLTLIHNAQITTIDSFCLYVIRNHFHEIDLEPNFRIGDEGELKLLKEDVLAKVLEENYEKAEPDFLALADGYAAGRSDEALTGMILQLYEFSKSYPWPKEWLLSCAKDYQVQNEEELDKALWMEPLTEHIRHVAQDLVALSKEALSLTQQADGPYMYQKAVESDLAKYRTIAACSTFSEFYQGFTNLSYDRLASSRNFEGSAEKQEQVKTLRDSGKETVKKLCRQYFFTSIPAMIEQLQKTEPMAKELVRLTLEFSEYFAAEKRRKNLVDFHDLEHFALEILVDEETKEIRKTAEEFKDTFVEIMIDEYQDSNEVQETILKSISRESRGGNNIFMVGDVKQSIYRFRLARPELFMEKYDTYSLEESDTQRIDLHKNFRSRKEVLDCTNDIFYKIMTRNLGNVEYDAAAALYEGASYLNPEEEKKNGSKTEENTTEMPEIQESAANMFVPEILVLDSGEELLEDSDMQDKRQLEAKMIGNRIKALMKEQLVTDKKTGELRNMRYSDVVILLRSLSGFADSFASTLGEEGIPAHTVSATGYFSAVEVQTVLSMLRILDNPKQDIPLTAVLRSPIGGLDDEELAAIRLREKNVRFHICVQEACEEAAQKEGKEPLNSLEKKLASFYKIYGRLRAIVPDTPIHELIEVLLKETGYGDYAAAMPAGKRRRANLEMLIEKAIAYENTSYKGLFHFVRYIDELRKYDVDFGEADMTSENEDVVRIMSIHKSKGLEFPVVFVAGMGKNFNKQDTRSKMVLHPEYGLGLDCMDGKKRIKSPTIAKKAIAKQIDLENLGEELRVLYVALTRAKEKLILTGMKKDAKEALSTYALSAKRETPLSYLTREGAAGYLDWVLPAVLSYGEKYQITLIDPAELVVEELGSRIKRQQEKEDCIREIEGADKKRVEELSNGFSKVYAYKKQISRKNKYSVSELKHRAMREMMQREEEETTPIFKSEEIVPYVPGFARRMENTEEEINQGALRGTAVHRVMECYEFSSELKAEEQIKEMLAREKITKEMYDLVKISLVEDFVASDIGKRMKRAEEKGRLYREKPFVMGFTAAELLKFGFDDGIASDDSEETEDLTLIQGIIDAFWIEEDGIVILDYKTDRIETGQELIDRYAAQLRLYGEALERIYAQSGLKVKERLLYSFRLGEVILVPEQ